MCKLNIVYFNMTALNNKANKVADMNVDNELDIYIKLLSMELS